MRYFLVTAVSWPFAVNYRVISTAGRILGLRVGYTPGLSLGTSYGLDNNDNGDGVHE
jgi:hypothetical protein